jgi:hypothetical protein
MNCIACNILLDLLGWASLIAIGVFIGFCWGRDGCAPDDKAAEPCKKCGSEKNEEGAK